MPHKNVLLATRPLVPPWDEASKNFAYFLGREISGHTLTLLTTPKHLEGLPKSVHEEPIFRNGHFDIFSKIALFSYLRNVRTRFDITHYLFTPTKQNTSLIKFFAKPTHGKTIQTVATLRDDLYTAAELKQLLFADRIVVYTDRSKEKLEHLGLSNVTRIYPGIDLNRYRPETKNPAIIAQLGFNEHHFIVVYPGEYVRLGATDMLVDTWIDFFAKHPETDIRFVFACRVKHEADAAKKAAVRKRFEDAGLLAYVAFSDTISDMPGLYNTSDIIVFPVGNLSGKFDVPLIIIEAYACGKPVILSDLPQFDEFSNPDICVTIPKGSGSDMIEKLAYLKDNEEECERLGNNARRFVKDRFDLKHTAEQYGDIYAAL
jgi:glycosyltransferase involved in cell wall biosynthesis